MFLQLEISRSVDLTLSTRETRSSSGVRPGPVIQVRRGLSITVLFQVTSLETKISWNVTESYSNASNAPIFYMPGSGDLRMITRATLRLKVKNYWSQIIR